MRLLWAVTVLWCLHFTTANPQAFTIDRNNAQREISVDYDNDRFLINGQPFQYIAGSFHYFRAVPESWRRIIRLMKAAGLNAVSTYVEWSLHNPSDGAYRWDGIADLERFIEICTEESMYVLIRPGPYICAERDLGGFPVWLLQKYPSIRLRTTDPDYIREVERWYAVLMPRVQKHLYGRGGNVILVQVENEYGSMGCDYEYTYKIRDITQTYVGTDALLYTTDGPSKDMVRCGHINGTVQSIDFGSTSNPMGMFKELRKWYPRGPLINSEFYPGWLSHWQDRFPVVAAEGVASTLDLMIRNGVNVNFYMFFGGTNFGFTSGANTDPKYRPQTTSYDYDAPLTEAGDVTDKYWAIRNVTSRYVHITTEVAPNTPKMALSEPVKLTSSVQLLDARVRGELCQLAAPSTDPATFEQFNQRGGLVIYETQIPRRFAKDPLKLSVREIRDRALVYVDRVYVGVLSREREMTSLNFSPNNGKRLQVIVEDQGRVNYGYLDTWKGFKDLRIENRLIHKWNNTACPLDDGLKVSESVRAFGRANEATDGNWGPTFFVGEFTVSQVLDTYLDLTEWTKGVAYVNGHNLGRYWSTVPPQRALYVPKEFLRPGANEVILLELQAAPEDPEVSFIDHPLLS